MRFLLLFCLFCTSLCADVPPPAETGEEMPTRNQTRLIDEMDKGDHRSADFTGELAQLALSFGAILAILLVLSWLVKRTLNKRLEQSNLTSDIQILEKRYLNPKAAIYLIKIGNKNIIVGESPQGLVNLGERRLMSDEL